MKTSTSKNRTVNRTLLLFLFCAAVWPFCSSAQVGQWTWLHGDSTVARLANYGTQTIFDPANNPSGLYEACQWTDTSGMFWLFGGCDSYEEVNGDLWEYDPSINQWAWMNGSGRVNDNIGSYGTQGVPSLNNYPPSRSHGMATWTDKNNNLWFFGGAAVNVNPNRCYNDLWEYNIVNDEWTWMKGPDTTDGLGHYGIMGVPDTANNPPNRAETSAAWVDSSGDLWLFGGETLTGVYNDLWRFNIVSNTWTWMKGSSTLNDPGNYGTQEIENAANNPPSRAVYAHLKDKNENLWLFGGFNDDILSLNDIWRYNPVTNNWAWLYGSKTSGATGNDGTKCIADSNNIPGARFENRACWLDKNNNFWFFGGFLDNSDVSNELWKYCIQSNEWALVSGDTISNPTGNWGTIGVSSPTNLPDGRAGSVSWIDTTAGNLYMYGGATNSNLTGNHEDLWRFTIDTNCAVCAAVVLPVAQFQSSDTIVCQNDCLTFTDLSRNATSWIWSFPGAFPDTSTDENPQSICYYTPGTYNVSLIATSYKGSSQITLRNFIKVNPSPSPPDITTLHNDTLYCHTNPSYVSYQWYLDSAMIQGATDTILVITHGGNYNVQVKDSNGCSIAVGINILGVQEYTLDGIQFTVSPNPVADILTLTGTGKPQTASLMLDIYNVLGQKMYSRQLETANLKSGTVIDVSTFSSGIYFIQLSNDTGKWIGKFVKE